MNGYPCLWAGCHEDFPVGWLAYLHMTDCPHRPQETK